MGKPEGFVVNAKSGMTGPAPAPVSGKKVGSDALDAIAKVPSSALSETGVKASSMVQDSPTATGCKQPLELAGIANSGKEVWRLSIARGRDPQLEMVRPCTVEVPTRVGDLAGEKRIPS